MEANYPILEWRIGLRQSGWKEVLRAPAAHGVSSNIIVPAGGFTAAVYW